MVILLLESTPVIIVQNLICCSLKFITPIFAQPVEKVLLTVNTQCCVHFAAHTPRMV